MFPIGNDFHIGYQIRQDEILLAVAWNRNEELSHLSGNVLQQNFLMGSGENPKEFERKPLCSLGLQQTNRRF